jgi:hypothetical protein
MPTLDFESDRFLQLLTDALRAGPGSPEWHEAVTALKGNGTSHGDDYQLLLNARQNLESGKEYRSVRAGPGFARKLNDALEEEAAAPHKNPVAPTTGIVAIVSALLILTAAAVLCYLLFPDGVPTAEIEKLSNTYFIDTVSDANFDSPPPIALTPIGSLPLEMNFGLHPASAKSGAMTGGGIVLPPFPANEARAIEVSIKINRPSDDLIAEVFVSDSPDFDPQRGTSNHELVWLYQAGQAKVILPGGTTQTVGTANRDFRGTIPIRIALNHDVAILEQSGKQNWAGANQLDPAKPRTIGLRFLKTGDDKNPEPAMAFVSLKVTKP